MVKPDRKKPKPAIDIPNYVISKKVGEGTYGVVWRATNKATNTTVALKCIKLEGCAPKVVILCKLVIKAFNIFFFLGKLKAFRARHCGKSLFSSHYHIRT